MPTMSVQLRSTDTEAAMGWPKGTRSWSIALTAKPAGWACWGSTAVSCLVWRSAAASATTRNM